MTATATHAACDDATTTAADIPVTLESIRAARERIDRFVHRTPALTCATLDKMASRDLPHDVSLLLKCENFNKVGAFKIRGGSNAVLKYMARVEAAADAAQQTAPAKKLAVCTHSSGNHAQAIACAAQAVGIDAHIIMPSNAPGVKKAAVRDTYGARVYECEPTQAAREATCERIQQETGAEFIHPYNNWDVIEGQGTAMLELHEQAQLEHGKTLDVVLCCVGGGGFCSGTSIAARGLDPNIRVFGCEPVGANDAYNSFRAGTRVAKHEADKPSTCCDGLLTLLGDKTWAVLNKNVEDVFLATEEQIVRAMKLVYERMKIVIEPSTATTVAVALFNEDFRRRVLADPRVRNIGVMISGGNVEFDNVLALFAKYAS